MKLLAYLAAVVAAVLAAVFGWSALPHHAFALLSIALACVAAGLALGEPRPS